jgi:hypothetical protein
MGEASGYVPADPAGTPANPNDRETATDPAAETRSTPEVPEVNLPDSAAFPNEPLLDENGTPVTADQGDAADGTAGETAQS